MSSTISKAAVLFSLVFTLVLTGAISVTTETADDTNVGISVCSDLWFNDFVEY